jgi:hypothetical protein
MATGEARALRAGPGRLPLGAALARPGVRWALLFAAGVAISAFTIRRGVDPFDEGLTLQAARRMAHGELPYRDFLWSYGFAQPLLLGGLFKAFGVSLLWWRVIRVLVDGAVAAIVFALVRREAPAPVALVAWLVAACAAAEPTGAGAAPLAMLWALAAILVAGGGRPGPRRAAGAGALVALAAAWRPDFAVYGGAGVLVTLALRGGWRPALACLGTAVLLSLVAYAPFAAAAGPGRLADRLVALAFRDHAYWSLPFPLHYHGPLRGWPPGALAGDLRHALRFYLPLLSVVGVGAAALGLALRGRRPSPAAAGLLAFALGGVLYLRSRPDVVHVQLPLVILAALLPLTAIGGWKAGGRWGAWRAPEGGAAQGAGAVRHAVAAVAVLAFALVGVNAVANRVSALVDPPTLASLHAPGADGVEVPPAEARALDRVVALVRARVPPGEPIYVAPRRADLIKVNDPLVYVLADRANAGGEDFGLLAGDAAQRRIVARLERTRPRVVVRWTDPVSSQREPNRRGIPSGSHRLDDYLAAHYRLLERLYHYDVLVPR